MSTQCFKLDGGRAVADPMARRLLVEGEAAKLGGRAFDLLLTLIEHRDRVVSKQELLDLVWPGLVVEENNLHVQVVVLRKLLGSAAIATVSGRGYRLALRVEAVAESDASAVSEAAPLHGGRAPSAPPPPPPVLTAAPLIGRDALLDQVERLLDEPGTRWLTLLGPGGSGKTRLALVAAARRADRHPDGVWSVMLAGVRDPMQVPSAVASTLGLQESAAQTAADQLRDFLRHRQVLLVLDNLEHLLPQAGAALLRLLEAGPGVRVLATSRLALQAVDERTLDVPPLALPPAGEEAPAGLRAAPALQLLAERARGLGQPLRDQPGTWRAAASICRRLDGLPLAIELAAARLRTLTPEALAARLDQSLGLLRTGDAHAPERHQTLRATVAWSHDLLPADVQRLFRALGVFVGGWSLESAEAIDEEPAETVVRLETLLEHHLVQRLDDVDDRPRYGMLETIREYALERAEAAGELSALRLRHARIMAALALREEPEVLSARRPAALLRLGAERANLRAALHFVSTAGSEGGVSLWADLVSRLGWWWYFDDGLREGEGWSAPLLEKLGTASDARAARCWTTGARVAFYRGENEIARQRSARALELARQAGDAPATAHALLIRALSLNTASRAEANATMAICLDEFRAVGEPWGMALATQYRGVLLYFQPNEVERSEVYLKEGGARFEALGDTWGSTATAAYLSLIAVARGDLDAADRLARQNLQSARATGDRFRESAGLHQVARIAWARGESERAVASVRENIALQVERGALTEAVELARWLAFLHWRLGDTAVAARLLGACGPPGPVTPLLLLLGPERMAEAAQVQRELPEEMPPERWQLLSAEGASLGVERLLGLVSEPHRPGA